MRSQYCAKCANEVYFENDRCLSCGALLGFDPAAMALVTLDRDSGGNLKRYEVGAGSAVYCANVSEGVCNWLCTSDDAQELCIACRLNRTIPNLSEPGSAAAWAVLEHAKKRLVYSLLRFGMPLTGTPAVPVPLTFDFSRNSITGHLDGVITIDINETDPVERERQRTQLDESYRSVLGHMRHEVGHYYWMLLFADAQRLEEFRTVFGDERTDYSAALAHHYAAGPPADWQTKHVSLYASAHPWEDWSETWAHYLHMVDALETAAESGLEPRPAVGNPATTVCQNQRQTSSQSQDQSAYPRWSDVYRDPDFDELMARWAPLTKALNQINRSMGHGDFYPFVISETARKKLAFVHKVIRASCEMTPCMVVPAVTNAPHQSIKSAP